MTAEEKLIDCQRRAQAVREIAQGLYDQTERRTVLELADEFEKMAASKETRR